MDASKLSKFVNQVWDDSVIPSITEYIKIPNKSPAFDKDWEKHGYMADAVKLMVKWAREKLTAFPGAKLEVVQLPGRTPLIFMDIPGDSKDTVLLYGHLDKQPEMVGWEEGLGPWTPVRKGDRLFGRGSADDGYAIYASLTALLALKDQGIQRARCVVLIEACEESGSGDLPHYVDHLAARIGDVSLVVCLDSGCGNYDQLWLTTSLRGIAMGNLTVRVLTEGVHSGDGSGLVPSSFRIARALLSRVEDEKTGEIKLQDMYVQVPPKRIEQAKQAAENLGDAVYSKMPFAGSHQAGDERSHRAGAQPHLAPATRGDGYGGLSAAGERRQCGAAVLDVEAVVSPAADTGCRQGDETPQRNAGDPIRLTTRTWSSMRKMDRAAGTRRRWRRGWRNPSTILR